MSSYIVEYDVVARVGVVASDDAWRKDCIIDGNICQRYVSEGD